MSELAPSDRLALNDIANAAVIPVVAEHMKPLVDGSLGGRLSLERLGVDFGRPEGYDQVMAYLSATGVRDTLAVLGDDPRCAECIEVLMERISGDNLPQLPADQEGRLFETPQQAVLRAVYAADPLERATAELALTSFVGLTALVYLMQQSGLTLPQGEDTNRIIRALILARLYDHKAGVNEMALLDFGRHLGSMALSRGVLALSRRI